MFSAVFQWILSFLSAPILNSLVDAYKAKLASTNTTDQKALDLAVADLQAQIEARKLATTLGTQSKVAAIVQAAFAFPVVVYMNKILLVDLVFGEWTHSSTPAVQGSVGVWCGLIISFFFGGAIISNAVTQITGRFKK